MADGDYERRSARDAELKRFKRMIAEMRKKAEISPPVSKVPIPTEKIPATDRQKYAT